jgi:hypothetical protein
MLTIDGIKTYLGNLASQFVVSQPAGVPTLRVTFAGYASSRNDERRALVDAKKALESSGRVVADCQAFLIVQS